MGKSFLIESPKKWSKIKPSNTLNPANERKRKKSKKNEASTAKADEKMDVEREEKEVEASSSASTESNDIKRTKTSPGALYGFGLSKRNAKHLLELTKDASASSETERSHKHSHPGHHSCSSDSE